MNPKNTNELGPDSGAYVLHALTDDENARFEATLAGNEDARAEVTELADTAVELGLSVEPVAPPADLRARILDQVAVTPQLAPVSAPLQAVETAATQEHGTDEHEIARPAEERARRRWYTQPITTLVAAAAAAALIFGGGFGVNAVIQGQQASATAASISQIQSSSDFERRTVDVANGGKATVIWSVALRRSAMLATGLTKLPDGKTYELWYMRADGAVPAGTFVSTGSETQSVILTGKMNAGDAIGMSIEPSGGSHAPTTTPIAVVTTST